MVFLKKSFALLIALVVGGFIWFVFGAFLSTVLGGSIWVGAINGSVTLIGGILVNVGVEKLLGINESANV